MEKLSITDEEADAWFDGETPGGIKIEKKYDLLKASPAEYKTFSREDRRYWIYGQMIFKSSWRFFGEKEDELVEEEEPDSESSEEFVSEEEEEESDDEPNTKESKMNDNMGYGPRGTK